MANLEYGVPITDSTRFVLASVSKQFTAFAVHLLVREGRIDLDADIRQYIPELPDLGARITPRDLLHHTSGLRESLDLVRLAGWRPEDVLTMEDVLRLAYRQRALNFPPGSEYSYCNLGYVLLAELVRRTSGQPFSVFARERIFAPLGMKDTFFHDDYRMIVPLRAESYRRAGSAWVKVYYPYGTVGSGGLVSTLRDLIIWERFFREPPAGFRELIEAMQQPGRLRDGRELAYGSGLMLGRQHCGLSDRTLPPAGGGVFGDPAGQHGGGEHAHPSAARGRYCLVRSIPRTHSSPCGVRFGGAPQSLTARQGA
jgi:CubicO group peptidase (beta-lactamase class C family)